MRSAISLRQLEVFLAIARHGQVTRAARALHLTQSATSMSLAQLEKLLQLQLFRRDAGKMVLTERGSLLLSEAPDLVERVRLLPSLLAGRGIELRGELRIAASTTVGRYLIAPALASFSAHHPLVRVRLTIGNAGAAAAAVKSHDAEIAYVEGTIADPELEVTAWKKDQMAIVTSALRWGRRRRNLSRQQLAALEWVMREPGSGTREILEHSFAALSLPSPTERLRLDDSEAILQTVGAGFGVACLSELVVRDVVRTGRLATLRSPGLKMERTLWRVSRRGLPLGPVPQAFIAFAGGDL